MPSRPGGCSAGPPPPEQPSPQQGHSRAELVPLELRAEPQPQGPGWPREHTADRGLPAQKALPRCHFREGTASSVPASERRSAHPEITEPHPGHSLH